MSNTTLADRVLEVLPCRGYDCGTLADGTELHDDVYGYCLARHVPEVLALVEAVRREAIEECADLLCSTHREHPRRRKCPATRLLALLAQGEETR